jgi:hypothetical protein
MTFRNPLRIANRTTKPLTIAVRPGAEEYEVAPGAECEIVATHPGVLPTFSVEPLGARLSVAVNEGGSHHEFWLNGERVG